MVFSIIFSSLTCMHICCVSGYRAIVLEPGNPSMKNQIKQLAAAECMHLLNHFFFFSFFFFVLLLSDCITAKTAPYELLKSLLIPSLLAANPWRMHYKNKKEPPFKKQKNELSQGDCLCTHIEFFLLIPFSFLYALCFIF